MEFGVGSILDGKVTGITKFGAFVALPEGRSGLVHISEIAYSYVNEVSDYLTVQNGPNTKLHNLLKYPPCKFPLEAAPAHAGHGPGPRSPNGGSQPATSMYRVSPCLTYPFSRATRSSVSGSSLFSMASRSS